MEHGSELDKELTRLVGIKKSKQHWFSYNLIRTKRFFLQTIMAFVFYYLAVINLSYSFPALPLYPPISITFILFLLFGNTVAPGLLLAGVLAYSLKGMALDTTILYLLADIGGGFLGAHLSTNVFSSDITKFSNWREWIQFIKVNALVTCVFSSLIKLIAFLLASYHAVSYKILLFYFMDLWLADLNAILVLTSFVTTWMSVYFSRETVSHRILSKLAMGLLVLSVLLIITFMKKMEVVYLISAVMIASLYFSRKSGYLVATLLSYTLSTLYLAYFLLFKQYYIVLLGVGFYSLISFSLFLYIICMLYVGMPQRVRG